MRPAIPTIYGFEVPSDEDCAYIDYLDELYDAPNYGLLMFKGDPLAFSVGRDEWLTYEDIEDDKAFQNGQD